MRIPIPSLKLCVLLIGASAISSACADPLDFWQWRNPLPQGHALSEVVCAQGKYVAVGVNGAILTSINASDWSVRDTVNTSTLSSVAYGNGQFVAVGVGTWTSPDGTNWVQRNTAYWNKVIYTNSTFFALGSSGEIAKSTDGITWTFRNSGLSVPLNDITWANGVYVVAGGYYTNSALLTSTDGITWSNRTFTSDQLHAVTYGAGNFVAIGFEFYGPEFVKLSSPDGVHWTRYASSSPAYSYGLAFGNGTFVLAGDGLWSSPDGVFWTRRYAEPDDYLYSVTACQDLFVAVGNAGSIVTSIDGTNWIRRTTGTSESIYALAASSNSVLAVGRAGATLLSSNGASWSYRNVGASTYMNSVVYADGRFVAAGSIGGIPTIFESSNGMSWASQTQPGPYLAGIAFAEGQFVLVGGDGFGTSGFIRTSSNAVDWTIRSIPTTNSLSYVCSGNGQFVATGGGGVILTSSDRGATWTQRSSGTTNGVYGVSWAGGLFLAGDVYGTVLTSSNGISWAAHRIDAGTSIYGVAFANGTFVAVGGYGILTSTNAIDWWYRPRPFAWDRLNAVLWFNDSFLIAGESGILLQSVPMTPPRFEAHRQSAGSFEFSVLYAPGQSYRIQTATNLNEDWIDWRSVTNSSGATVVVDSNNVSPRRFYRAVAP